MSFGLKALRAVHGKAWLLRDRSGQRAAVVWGQWLAARHARRSLGIGLSVPRASVVPVAGRECPQAQAAAFRYGAGSPSAKKRWAPCSVRNGLTVAKRSLSRRKSRSR